jgi:hypothetical protein
MQPAKKINPSVTEMGKTRLMLEWTFGLQANPVEAKNLPIQGLDKKARSLGQESL